MCKYTIYSTLQQCLFYMVFTKNNYKYIMKMNLKNLIWKTCKINIHTVIQNNFTESLNDYNN